MALRRRLAVLLDTAKRTHRQLHRVLLALIAALLLSVALGYAGLSGFGGVAFAAAARNPPVLGELPAAKPAATSNTKVPKLGGPGGRPLKPFLTVVLADVNKKWARAFADAGYRYTYARVTFSQRPS